MNFTYPIHHGTCLFSTPPSQHTTALHHHPMFPHPTQPLPNPFQQNSTFQQLHTKRVLTCSLLYYSLPLQNKSVLYNSRLLRLNTLSIFTLPLLKRIIRYLHISYENLLLPLTILLFISPLLYSLTRHITLTLPILY